MKKDEQYYKNGLTATEPGTLLLSAAFGGLYSRQHQSVRPRSMDAPMDYKFQQASCVWHLARRCPGDHQHVPCEGGQGTRLSALSPAQMAKKVAHMIKVIHDEQRRHPRQPGGALHAGEVHHSGECGEAFTLQPDSLKGHTDEELLHWATNLMKLRKKLDHPSSQALVKMLRKMLTLAGNLHCLDCAESRMRRPHGRAVTLEGAERL